MQFTDDAVSFVNGAISFDLIHVHRNTELTNWEHIDCLTIFGLVSIFWFVASNYVF